MDIPTYTDAAAPCVCASYGADAAIPFTGCLAAVHVAGSAYHGHQWDTDADGRATSRYTAGRVSQGHEHRHAGGDRPHVHAPAGADTGAMVPAPGEAVWDARITVTVRHGVKRERVAAMIVAALDGYGIGPCRVIVDGGFGVSP